MSNYTNLRNGIISVIKTNGNNEITGQLLQNELLAMITTLGYGYQFMGIATPTTAPGMPDAKVFYIAYTPGTYTNFGGIAVTGLCVLKYATSWIKEDIPVSGGGGGTEFTVEPTDLALVSGTPNKLKFADRIRNSNITSGQNYIIVRDVAQLKNNLANIGNAIYEIRDDFDLGTDSVTIAGGVILRFNGGSISNGTLTGNNTVIDAGNSKIFEDITFAGTFVGPLNAMWIGATPQNSNFDNSDIINAWFGGYANVFKKLYFPTDKYYFLSTASLQGDIRDLVLDGNNSNFNINIPDDNGSGRYFLSLSNTGSGSSGEQFRLENVIIKNVRKTDEYDLTKTRAILFDRTQRFEVSNVQIWYFDIAVVLIDCWYGSFNNQNVFRSNRIGVLCTGGTSVEINTIECHNIDFKGVGRDEIAAIYPQESGESDADYIIRTASCGIDAYTLLQGVAFRGCVFEGLDYGIRTNWRSRASQATQHGGAFVIDSCYFEANRVEDIYIGSGNYKSVGSGSNIFYLVHDVTISNCRFWTLKHAFIAGAYAFIFGNEEFTLKVSDGGAVTTCVDYQGQVTIDGNIGGSVCIHKIGCRPMGILTSTGAMSTPATNFQKLQQTRYFGNVMSRLNGYSKTSSSANPNRISFKSWNFETEPKTRFVFDIFPIEFYKDTDNAYSRLMVPSGNAMVPVLCSDEHQFNALNNNGDISLYEFIRRWKAGISFTGTVKNLFPYEITADPSAGTVRDSGGTLVGFGINALGTTVTTSTATGYYLFVETLNWVRISYSKIKPYCDALQCGRTYYETHKGVDESSIYTDYISCYGTNAKMASVQKRLNAVYYDTTNSKLMIYTGFEWVEMTSPFQRYYYKEYGLKLAERATMADLPGQTFINYATGIKYTFMFRQRNNFKWVPSIGMVDDLAHPNGYADDNTLDYANELSVGEMVMYNGALYKWDGTQLVAV